MQLAIPAISAAGSVYIISQSVKEKGQDDAKRDTVFQLKIDNMGVLLAEVKEMLGELSDGYHSNKTRITKVEDHLESHSREIKEMKSRIQRLEERK